MTFTKSERKFNKQLRGGVHNMKKFYSSQKGFTLIELLIVIVIIGILSGVVLTVINPAKQISRSRQTVWRSTAEKACLALGACAASTQTAASCGTDVLIGFTVPTGDPAIATGGYPITVTGLVVSMTSTYDGCTAKCDATPSTGAFTNFTVTGANCLVL
jgi:prepilin-type N-terminal cleavage/methylation domain-containing protein